MSRELDERIACEVMGWELKGEPYTRWVLPDGRELIAPPPAFSTDIAAAWVVVEKMRMAVWPDAALFARDGKYYHGWRATVGMIVISGEYRAIDGQTAVEATAPLAICRAALAAVGATGEGEETT